MSLVRVKYPTIMDGIVIRFYTSASSTRQEVMSVSRRGVLIHCFLHLIPSEELKIAEKIFEILVKDTLLMDVDLRDEGIEEFITHRTSNALGRELEAVDAIKS